MTEQVEELEQVALTEIAQTEDAASLEALRVKFVGKNGQVKQLLRSVGSLSPEERPVFGQRVNRTNATVTEALAKRLSELQTEQSNADVGLDRSLPGRRPANTGRKHPLTLIREEVVAVFNGMGFTVADGPEVELDYYNFEALNIPKDHPARDTQDTFYINDEVVLRTHTSSVQIRVMEKEEPPVRVIAPGRCYRHENPDASHAFTFHQCEGLYVDRGVTLANLKGDLTYFARQLFGQDVQVRFRPDFFPFTEPSVEYSFSCPYCAQSGCSVCKGSGWIEIAGAGMVDPAVFDFVNYDPEEYTGYAFGMGLDRLAMIKYGIESVSLFLENDLRFIEQG